MGANIMKTFNNFKIASELYRGKLIKGGKEWYETIREASVNMCERKEEDKRIKDAIVKGLVIFFKVNKEGIATERTERRVAPLDGYQRKTDRKPTDTYKVIDLGKLAKFVRSGIEEEKAKLMSIISFNRWQFEYDI